MFQALVSKGTELVLTQISHATFLTASGFEVTTDIQVQIKIFPRELGCGAWHAAEHAQQRYTQHEWQIRLWGL